MTVSAHLTPEPERRLWLILELVRHAAEQADRQLLVLTCFAAVELGVSLGLWAGPGTSVLATLGLALPAGALGLMPLARAPSWLGFLNPPVRKQGVDDSLVSPEDLVKYAAGELVLRLDRYLGGGITATQYFEDIVAQILLHARLAARKRRVLAFVWALVALGQLVVLAKLAGIRLP